MDAELGSAKKKDKKGASKEPTPVAEVDGSSDDDEGFEPTVNDSKDAPDEKNAAKKKEEQKNKESALAVGLGGALPKTLILKVLLPGTDTVRES